MAIPNGAPRPALGMYFGASRLRNDTWDQLRTVTRKLMQRAERGDVEPLIADVTAVLDTLEPLEAYWTFPGAKTFRELRRLLGLGRYPTLAAGCATISRQLVSDGYRGDERARRLFSDEDDPEDEEPVTREGRPCFTVLIVDDIAEREQEALRDRLHAMERPEDEFVYDLLIVTSFEDALIAGMLNYNIQTCIIRYGFPFQSKNDMDLINRAVAHLNWDALDAEHDADVGLALGRALKRLRPTVDLFLVTDAPVEDVAGKAGTQFRRVFYREEDYLELHISILKGVRERYHTPFFNALKTYSQKPTGVFHALPISRSKSIIKSHWIRDMGDFYGTNVFLAETSATTGGLDSLLQPTGPIRDAQRLAARAFGARETFFVTNGTSTANKIVLQALLQPEDIVLVSRDCHKSHHYSLVLLGALPIYMDPYPITAYSMYGAVPVREIKRHLLALKRDGKLDRVKVLLLTNCTFDGVVYNVERVMEEVLAIKPDIAFVWDEAWWAFGYFTPISRRRTGMGAAARLREKLDDPKYAERYAEHAREQAREQGALDPNDDDALLSRRLLPDPALAEVRVYTTQSTHKTLTAMRQGSMIHVNDERFEQEVHGAFVEAFMTHTSTSPNYQILSSLDVGRRQVELEGYELVQHAIELAVTLRERISAHPLLSKHFAVLTPADLIPAEYRPSGFASYREVRTDWARMDQAWDEDELCLDPTRVTLSIGGTGIDGDTFKKRLIEQYDIQINKTSRNTVLFLTHIGTTRGSVAYLIEVLIDMASKLDDTLEHESGIEQRMREGAINSLTVQLPPLPNFSRFHDAFRSPGQTGEGDLRRAYFLAGEEPLCEYLKLDGTVERAIANGREVVTAAFIIPYPPGFPVLVPGQVVSEEILTYIKALDVKEIHGYYPDYGVRVFTDAALAEETLRRGVQSGSQS